MQITYSDFIKRVASAINQTDQNNNLIPHGFALPSEVLRYTNDGQKAKVELLASKMHYVYEQFGNIDIEANQKYYRYDVGDTADISYLLSEVLVKYSDSATDYTEATLVTQRNLEKKDVVGTESHPYWAYVGIDSGDGINHLGIRLDPMPTVAVSEGILFGFPQYPPDITGGSGIITFYAHSELEWLTYYVAVKSAVKSGDEKRLSILGAALRDSESNMLSGFAPHVVAGSFNNRSFKQSSRSYNKMKGRI